MKSDVELSLALGSVEYEMYLLAGAVLVPGARSSMVRELAREMMRLKYRTLVEFLTAVRHKNDQITVRDFGLPARPKNGPLYRYLSGYSAHLAWARAVAHLPKRRADEEHCTQLLSEVADACLEIHARGVRLTAKRHVERHPKLRGRLKQLGIGYAP